MDNCLKIVVFYVFQVFYIYHIRLLKLNMKIKSIYFRNQLILRMHAAVYALESSLRFSRPFWYTYPQVP